MKALNRIVGRGLMAAATAVALSVGSPLADARKPDDGAAPPAVAAALRRIAAEIDVKNLREIDAKLVGYGTRSTISDVVSDVRGIGAARRWAQSQFASISEKCGGCLTIATPTDIATGERFAHPTEVTDIVAVQTGTSDPDRVIIIQGHIDSRNSDTMNVTDDAPGANDDGSGVAAVLETARVLSRRKFPATVVYAVLSGEEQGLHGGRILAAYAKAHGWKIEAVLNNDIVGASEGMEGMRDATTVRVFSEGVRAVETPDMAKKRRTNGGELDSPSRNLARYIAGVAEANMRDFKVRMIYRMDRYGRGGDHAPFQEMGFPAVRITEGVENYQRQHQNVRTENGVAYGDTLEHVDFAYLANVTRLNALTMASLASAPAPPIDVKVEGAVSPNTTVAWQAVPGAATYRVWRRDTTSPVWEHVTSVPGSQTSARLEKIIIDDWFFGVAATSSDGYASPVVFAGPVGDFRRPDAPSTP